MQSVYRGSDIKSGPHPVSNRSLGRAFAAIAVGVAVLGGLIFHINQDETVLTPAWQRAAKPIVVSLMPQQWGFFTKSGREATMTALVRDPNGQWVDATTFPFGKPEHAFGLDRGVRAEGIEIGLIHSTVANASWVSCEPGSTAADCASNATSVADTEPAVASNITPEAQFCGELVLLNIQPAPWAFARIGQGFPTFESLWVDVQCLND